MWSQVWDTMLVNFCSVRTVISIIGIDWRDGRLILVAAICRCSRMLDSSLFARRSLFSFPVVPSCPLTHLKDVPRQLITYLESDMIKLLAARSRGRISLRLLLLQLRPVKFPPCGCQVQKLTVIMPKFRVNQSRRTVKQCSEGCYDRHFLGDDLRIFRTVDAPTQMPNGNIKQRRGLSG
ncbi:hypothetical protein BGW80DRAFT_661661 [Lactifluus volemus]|nr:hypothetical protein BGW80DRAFT_661661 [Lactifluus volemus]